MKKTNRTEYFPEVGDKVFYTPKEGRYEYWSESPVGGDPGGLFEIKGLRGFCSCCEPSIVTNVVNGESHDTPVHLLTWNEELQRWDCLDREWC